MHEENPEGKTVPGTVTLCKRKIGKYEEVERCQGFHQIKGLHCQRTIASTSIREGLVNVAVGDWQLPPQIDVEQGIHIELPEDYREF